MIHAHHAAGKVNSDCGLADRVQQSVATAGKDHHQGHIRHTQTLRLSAEKR